jgi:hypothetical protein
VVLTRVMAGNTYTEIMKLSKSLSTPG